MLVYQKNGEQVVLNFDDYYIQEEWFGAEDTVCFSLPEDHPQLPDMQPQLELTDKESGQRFLITSIDEGDVEAVLDLDELKTEVHINYSNGSATAANTITRVLPATWRVEDHVQLSTRRTIEMPGPTCLEIIQEVLDTYDVAVRFDNANRIVHIYRPDDLPVTGSYFTEELNLKKLPVHVSATKEFATRLYAVGKEGMTFSDINGGLPYVDNNEYSDRIVCTFWKDERYTVPESLLEDAKAKLAKMAKPDESYQCDVVDLARIDPEKWGQLTVSIYQGVILMDAKRNTRMVHRVARYRRYPHYPEMNIVTLSSVPGTLSRRVEQSYNAVTNSNSAFQRQHQAAVENATNWLTNGKGYMAQIRDDDGDWIEQVSLDTKDISTAKNVWRWNNAGFGHSSDGYNGPYTTAITQDGHIVADFIDTGNLNAGVIQAGILQSLDGGKTFYLDIENGIFRANLESLTLNSHTVETVEGATSKANAAQTAAEQNAAADATQKANDARDAANDATDEKLKSYPTTVDMRSAIEQTAENITSTVEKTYSTKSEVEQAKKDAADDATSKANAAQTAAEQNAAADATQKANDARDAANDATDEKLKSYSTTVEMQSAIDQTAESITSSVEKTISSMEIVSGGMENLFDGATWNHGSILNPTTGGGHDRVLAGTTMYALSPARAVNKRITFSVDYKVTKAITGTWAINAWVYYDSSSGYENEAVVLTSIATAQPSDEWVTVTGYIDAKDAPPQNICIYAYVYENSDGEFELRNPRCEIAGDNINLQLKSGDEVLSNTTILNPETVQTRLRSEITQTADSITQLVSTTDGIKESLSKVEQTANKISWLINDGGTSSSFTLTSRAAQLVADSVDIKGKVSFSDLYTPGNTSIIGDNIKTGAIQSSDGTTRYDLDHGTIQMGSDKQPNIYIDNEMIRWRVRLPADKGGGIGDTGIFYSIYASSWVGATSRYTCFGWVTGDKPSEGNDDDWRGLGVDYNSNEDCRAWFNTVTVDVPGTGGLGVSFGVRCNKLDCWQAGNKNAVMPTEFGDIRLTAVESPAPMFCDFGGGECNADGECYVALDDRFLETVDAMTGARWFLTNTDGEGSLTIEKTPDGAIIHGKPGQHFDWACYAAQRGTAGWYAEPCDSKNPALDFDTPNVLKEALNESWHEESDIANLLLMQEETNLDELLLEEVSA